MVDIRPVKSKQDLRDFIRVPRVCQAGDPCFIPRLDFEMMELLSAKNPYFQHARHCFFVAYDQAGQPCGRISAQVDDLAQTPDMDGVIGHFGFVEARDEAVLSALLVVAEGWLIEQGASLLHGPYSLSINEEVGLLVDGFEKPAAMMMNHAPQWYGQAIEASGYVPVKDLYAYDLNLKSPLSPSLSRLAEEAARIEDLQERALDMRKFSEELDIVLDVFNAAWSKNWGFIPMTDAEIAHTAKQMKMIIDPDLVRLIFIEGRAMAMIVGLPDVNYAIFDLKGRLFPFGWLKLIWRLRVSRVKRVRVLLMGVHPEVKSPILSGGLAALLIQKIKESAVKKGYESAEMSWVLDNNDALNRLMTACGGVRYKTYRLYGKNLQGCYT